MLLAVREAWKTHCLPGMYCLGCCFSKRGPGLAVSAPPGNLLAKLLLGPPWTTESETLRWAAVSVFPSLPADLKSMAPGHFPTLTLLTWKLLALTQTPSVW